MLKFLKSLFNPPSSEAEFRVRVITLKNGKQQFFPEYNQRNWGGWNPIVLINNVTFTTITTSVENDARYACYSKEQADINIRGYEAVLERERGEEIDNETILSSLDT